MKTNLFQKFRWAALASSIVVLAACGSKKDAGANIEISVSPETAPIVPSAGPSCVDKANAKTSGEVVSNSVSANRITFKTFNLGWNSTSTLSVSSITISMENEALSGGKFNKTLDSAEIEALLGVANAEFAGPVKIVSTDTAAKTNTDFAPCGLSIGGIPLATSGSSSPQSFTATVTIELIGTATDANGNESIVRETTFATAEFY